MSITLTERDLANVEMILTGAFAPLKGFLNEDDYKSVVDNMRLCDGRLWASPIVLAVSPEVAAEYREAMESLKDDETFSVELRDEYYVPVAELEVQSIYKPDLLEDCRKVAGTVDRNHPYVDRLLSNPDVYYIGGTLTKLKGVQHFDFKDLRKTPEDTKKYFAEKEWTKVVAFQTRNASHLSHIQLTLNCMKEAGKDAKLLFHPAVGPTQDEDIPYAVRCRCYKHILKHYPDHENNVLLSVLPLAMDMCSGRDCMTHAIVRKNYGATHFIVGRSHAAPSSKTAYGEEFYGPYDAQELVEKHKDEIGIEIISSEFVVYEPDTKQYYQVSKLPEGKKGLNISGTQFREALRTGDEIPSWFADPDVVNELRKVYRPLNKKGFCVFFTGLSGAGKTFLMQHFKQRLEEIDTGRAIITLDGDQCRTHISKGLGFSREGRSTNVRRIGYVASLAAKAGGIVLVSNINPFQEDRDYNRKLISKDSGYFLVHVATSLEKCEKRDCKNLYAKARTGEIKEFTGISSAYDDPIDADLQIISDNLDDLTDNLDRLTDMISAYI